MNRILLFIAAVLVSMVAVANDISVLPKPAHIKTQVGTYLLKDGCTVACPQDCPELGEYVVAMVKDRAKLAKVSASNGKGSINLRISKEVSGAEAYALKVNSKGIEIKASTKAGLLYGVQTLRQLIPNEGAAAVPYVEITDSPRFGWRGLHLDVSRHFFDVKQIKRFLDVMAMYKFNRFHWHLTDDQGWRIEIKSHPELTAKGGWRKGKGFVENQRLGFNVEDGSKYGGYYTQEEIKEVVVYAAKLGISVLPEIDLPGHSTAAIVACPQVFCFPDEKKEVRMEGGVSDGVMCAGKEATFALLQDVLDEVVTLFPFDYVHLGGDEAPKDGWKKCPDCQARIKAEKLADENELQAYFMKRLEKYLNSKGKKMVGWDEIMEGGVSKTATVMSWRGVLPGMEAAQGGNDVIMTPGSYVYLNQPQSVNPVTQTNGSVTSLRTVYEFEPVPAGLSKDAEKHIIGVQACQWTEHTPTEHVLYYKEYPRAIALAEVAWSGKESRNWDDFYARLQCHLPMLSHYGIQYGQPSYDVKIGFRRNEKTDKPEVWFTTEVPEKVYFTTDGSEPMKESAVYDSPIEITGDAVIKACTYRPDGSQGRVAAQDIHFHNALGKKVTYNIPYSTKHDGGGDYAMTNGMLGKWQGFEKSDADFVIDLGNVQDINVIESDWKYDVMDWVLRPTEVKYSVSADGVNFTAVHVEKFENTPYDFGKGIITVNFKKLVQGVRYIRVEARNEKTNPKWHSSAGAACWIFVDEVRVGQ